MSVLFEKDADSHVAVITINRPEARNAVNAAVATGIEDALDDVEADPEIWVAILTGAGGAFCAGADLKEVAAGNARGLRTRRGGFAGLVQRDRSKPLIAAVEGPCLAGGTEILLSCDLAVAASDATFGLPEVRRSLIAAGGGLFRLVRRIPYTVAMEWALTGDSYPAERAAQLGLGNAARAPGGALSSARELASRITANAPLAVFASRRILVDADTTADRGDVEWRRSLDELKALTSSHDYTEGVNAFVERRQPVWTAS